MRVANDWNFGLPNPYEGEDSENNLSVRTNRNETNNIQRRDVKSDDTGNEKPCLSALLSQLPEKATQRETQTPFFLPTHTTHADRKIMRPASVYFQRTTAAKHR